MNSPEVRSGRPRSEHAHLRQSAIIAVVVCSLALGGMIALAQRDPKKSVASPTSTSAPEDTAGSVAAGTQEGVTNSTQPETSVADPGAAADAAAEGAQDLDGSDFTTADSCLLTVQSVHAGASGSSVTCLQSALAAAGFYSGPASGTFDQATDVAVRHLQEDRNLFVDGVVGRETAISLGIWPDEESLVVHTPPPPEGAVDMMGYPLSTVSTNGPDAPPLPENSGSGKRVVYDRAGQRVWAVNAENVVIRSWLVSGSKYGNEVPGVHQVYSKSEVSTAWNGKAYLPKMIRYIKTDIGNIGFHGIPTHVSDGSPYQTEKELGQRLSGGCQRQANRDAAFLWDFADIGTTVVVI
jgi:peptidoglycan hydrolase-like protein with peptidoglycan-binding domain